MISCQSMLKVHTVLFCRKTPRTLSNWSKNNTRYDTLRFISNDNKEIILFEKLQKISSSVEMKDNSTNHVKVTYYSSCLGSGPPIATSKCDGLRVGDVVSFSAEIVVTQCPPNPRDWIQTFQIYPVGINESLVIDLEMLCSCACEQQGHPTYEPFSPRCKGHGTYKCGLCECDENHFGRKCECSM